MRDEVEKLVTDDRESSMQGFRDEVLYCAVSISVLLLLACGCFSPEKGMNVTYLFIRHELKTDFLNCF